MLSLAMKQKLFYIPPMLRNKGNAANFDLEKLNFCQLLNLYFSFYLLGNFTPSNDFSGKIIAIYFFFLKGVVFLKIIIW